MFFVIAVAYHAPMLSEGNIPRGRRDRQRQRKANTGTGNVFTTKYMELIIVSKQNGYNTKSLTTQTLVIGKDASGNSIKCGIQLDGNGNPIRVQDSITGRAGERHSPIVSLRGSGQMEG
ncbi:hypothetical protein Pst134EA_009856 [Puccinia striiformis f. sp. tritici]|uniref:hypothetical protein n=1 Tax=Puccinia striiformis f. sp. tritici TaxID=168172 RepID=UPI002007E636|nr:hypothetical protein Pst134EA_009856 [Puccinia striiformis f. sp. tritici]KAH9469334.1 hypothetical protein Pst134EA_009856 [Puccinia striiformis f. sp. tritici]